MSNIILLPSIFLLEEHATAGGDGISSTKTVEENATSDGWISSTTAVEEHATVEDTGILLTTAVEEHATTGDGILSTTTTIFLVVRFFTAVWVGRTSSCWLPLYGFFLEANTRSSCSSFLWSRFHFNYL